MTDYYANALKMTGEPISARILVCVMARCKLAAADGNLSAPICVEELMEETGYSQEQVESAIAKLAVDGYLHVDLEPPDADDLEPPEADEAPPSDGRQLIHEKHPRLYRKCLELAGDDMSARTLTMLVATTASSQGKDGVEFEDGERIPLPRRLRRMKLHELMGAEH